MRKTLFLLSVIFSSLILAGSASATDWFADRMNFPPGESRDHVQTITYTGTNLSVTIPENFTLLSYSSGGTLAGNVLSFGNGTNRNINYTIASPNNCSEVTKYKSDIYINNAFFDRFIFVCIADNKVVDYKLEYGHGDANYLSCNYISNETATLFNLIRVYNIGLYLDDDEDARNVSINCTFNSFPVRTYGHGKIDYENNKTLAKFFWSQITGGYWFRIAVLSQEVYGQPIGANYPVNCTDIHYTFTHEAVVAPFKNQVIELRTTTPFTIDVTEYDDKLTYRITNTEEYTVEGLVFVWKVRDKVLREEYSSLMPNETIAYDIWLRGNGTVKFTAEFLPCWYSESRNPTSYFQSSYHNFSIDYENPIFVDPNYPLILNISRQSTNDTNESSFKVVMGDVDSTARNSNYRTNIWIFDKYGRPINADITPTITVYDPVRNVIISSYNMTHNMTGIYTFYFNATSNMTTGLWETWANVTVGGVVVRPSDFWELRGSPALVRIESVTCSGTATSTTLTIVNEGGNDEEYVYEYCLVADETEQCGGGNDIDFGSAARLIPAGQSYNTVIPLNIGSNTGTLYFKVIVYFGTEKSGASHKFDTAICAPTPPSPPGGGGGGGGTYTPPKKGEPEIIYVPQPGETIILPPKIMEKIINETRMVEKPTVEVPSPGCCFPNEIEIKGLSNFFRMFTAQQWILILLNIMLLGLLLLYLWHEHHHVEHEHHHGQHHWSDHLRETGSFFGKKRGK